MEKQNRSLVREFFSVSSPYWESAECWIAFGLLGLIVLLTLGDVYVAVLFNRWDQEVFNAIQQVDKEASFRALLKWPLLTVFFIGVTAYQTYLIQMLSIRWRRWMTSNLLDKYLADGTFFFYQMSQKELDNPDQRITEDIRDFVDKTLNLSVRIFTEVVTFFSFVFILWTSSGSLRFTLFEMNIVIPGYIFWACLLYTALGTGLTHLLGKKLINLDYDQQKYEADFRFSLVRLRENAESIAVNNGAESERNRLSKQFQKIFSNFWEIMVKKKHLNFFTLPYNRASGFFAMAITIPKFFAKEITFGSLMMIQGAFFKVRNSLSFFVNMYAELALWRAILIRLSGFIEAMENAKTLKTHALTCVQSNSNITGLRLHDVSLFLPNDLQLTSSLNLEFPKGKSILVRGPSGSGKSTLFRAISANWPFMKGQISLPKNERILFLPQKPYLPVASLREILTYPSSASFDEKEVSHLLSFLELDHLTGELDRHENWSQILSPGEQQRVAFVRAFLQKPDLLFLDEATSALDEKMQAQVYSSLRQLLPGTTVVSIAHRATLESFHDIQFLIKKNEDSVLQPISE